MKIESLPPLQKLQMLTRKLGGYRPNGLLFCYDERDGFFFSEPDDYYTAPLLERLKPELSLQITNAIRKGVYGGFQTPAKDILGCLEKTMLEEGAPILFIHDSWKKGYSVIPLEDDYDLHPTAMDNDEIVNEGDIPQESGNIRRGSLLSALDAAIEWDQNRPAPVRIW